MSNHFGTVDNVILTDYDPDYANRFASEKDALLKLLNQSLTEIEHIGSTAVPGIMSKPVIDIAVTTHPFPINTAAIQLLEKDNWIYWEHNPDATHQFFFKGMPRTYILHIYKENDPTFRDKIFFRDYLLRHADAAKEYETLKISLASQYANDREKYTEMKSEFVASILLTHNNC